MTTDSSSDNGATLDSTSDLQPDQPPKWLNPMVAAVIGVVVLLLFGLTVLRTLGEVGTAPAAAATPPGSLDREGQGAHLPAGADRSRLD